MLEILRAELDKYHAFDAPSHPFVDSIVRAIPFTTVPEKMKTVFAISHVSQYASQFRRNTKLWDGTEVPTNNISFVVAASGANKDSSNSKVKACFKEGYKAIHAELEVFVRDEAIKAAQKAEEELPEEYAIYSKYMKPIPPPFMAMSTGPGLVQHINDIGALPLGAGMQYVGELSDELLGNPNAVENLKVLAECYTADMEVLTEKGFMLFSELPKDVKVAQWDKATRTISFALPTGYVDKDYDGLVNTFKTANGYDFTTTENHALVYSNYRKDTIMTSKFSDIEGVHSKYFITSGFASGQSQELSAFERLAIAYQADGSHLTDLLVRGDHKGTYAMEFGFTKTRKYEDLLGIIEGSFKYRELNSSQHAHNLVIYSPFKVSKRLDDVFKLPDFSLEKAKAFIEEVAKWDGSVRGNSIVYVSTVKENCDFVQAVALQCGYKTKMAVSVDDRSEKFSDVYRVSICKSHDGYSRFPARHKGKGTGQHVLETSHYKGKVYCVEMPEGTVIVRRNGLVNFNGNCFDLGNKEVSYTKGTEFRSKEISGQPVSALMVGSPGYILYDEGTRKKFHVTFMSKMARRSWFCYAPERIEEPDFSDDPDAVKRMLQYEAEIDQISKAAAKVAQGVVKTITEHNLKHKGEPIPTSERVFELFNIYKRYNSEVVNKANAHESVYSLVRSHLQWKALKFAGALAVIEGTDEVTAEQYIMAIRYCEMFDSDITVFERDMNKVPHESLSDYLRSKVEADNKSFISIHDIKKLGFSTSVTHPKLLELISLCAGYDRNGIYSIADNASGILYEPVRLSEVVGVSIKDIDNSKLHKAVDAGATHEELSVVKNRIAAVANTGYSYVETSFEELGELLKEDYAYSPFQFVNGERHRDNLIGGAKWLVIDVDTTTLSADDAHFLLEGINHHIALTSDPNNEYKYRVLIELDSYVELSAVAWKHFYSAIAADLGLDADILPQSQIYFSYAGRKVWSYTEGTSIECRDYIMAAKEKESSGVEKVKTLSKGQMSQLLADPLSTFWYAFDCVKGRRSTTLYRAARHAKDLGAPLEETVDLLEQINNYLTDPLGEERYTKLVEQIVRLYRSNPND